ncbi:hypothetical protein QCA50_015783 [Cerrena zonata]|uniref:Uncharacterized protein n=1 Tax=Cerrena zonata TaxID=2478898 RepID=A0AAW0FUG3_9APHY
MGPSSYSNQAPPDIDEELIRKTLNRIADNDELVEKNVAEIKQFSGEIKTRIQLLIKDLEEDLQTLDEERQDSFERLNSHLTLSNYLIRLKTQQGVELYLSIIGDQLHDQYDKAKLA